MAQIASLQGVTRRPESVAAQEEGREGVKDSETVTESISSKLTRAQAMIASGMSLLNTSFESTVMDFQEALRLKEMELISLEMKCREMQQKVEKWESEKERVQALLASREEQVHLNVGM